MSQVTNLLKMNLKEKTQQCWANKKIPQINNSEHCQWPGAWYSPLTSIYLICPHLHMTAVLSLRGRECGKALTLLLKLVMETCSWGQWMDWAWQPISSRKPFSGGAKAARCDPMRLSAGVKALADGPNHQNCPWCLLRPRPTLSIQKTMLKPGLCQYEGMKNRDLSLKLFLGQLPVVSISCPRTMLHRTKPQKEPQGILKKAETGGQFNVTWRNMFVAHLTRISKEG